MHIWGSALHEPANQRAPAQIRLLRRDAQICQCIVLTPRKHTGTCGTICRLTSPISLINIKRDRGGRRIPLECLSCVSLSEQNVNVGVSQSLEQTPAVKEDYCKIHTFPAACLGFAGRVFIFCPAVGGHTRMASFEHCGFLGCQGYNPVPVYLALL
jgi:hypothetical protein